MKKKSTSQSAFFHLRLLTGLSLIVAGFALALIGVDKLHAQSQQRNNAPPRIDRALLPPMFDCAQVRALGIHMQENLRAGALMVACGEAAGGSVDPDGGEPAGFVQEMLAPLLGTTDVDVITGTDTGTHITQSETFAAANPDNPNEIVVAYNDSRSAASSNFSGASVSTDGGATFTRLTKTNGQSPFANTFGDPVVLYNRPTGTWFTTWIDVGCGSQGMGGYKSSNPTDPNSWTHYCVHTGSFDDRESGWADNNPSSPFYGRMYVSWNDFARSQGIYVRYSTDNGATWSNEKQVTTTFIRNVQITGDSATGEVYIAGMDEQGGGLTNRINKLYKSSNGGVSWTNTYSGSSFPAPGRTSCPNSYFACMYSTPQGGYWRHMGWGQPAALNGVVHYVYDSRNTGNGDPGNVFYIRSTNGGVTFGAPFQLNTDAGTRAQWQPNISVGDDGSLLAVWYDERETSTCTKGNSSVPCYRMWARKSLDNGVTWQADEAFSDVVTPLPGQTDPNIIAEYAGDYDYSSAVLTQHSHTWTDGRKAVSGSSQQDPFFDRDPASGGGGDITLSARARRQGTRRSVSLRWSPADGGNINVLRDGTVVQTTADDGSTVDNLGTTTGTFTYQVCETDSSDCSNEVVVNVTTP
jgi:hypothetical protein